jgi:hypothetical protein
MSNRPRVMPVNFFDSATLTSNCTPALPLSNMQVPARDLVWRSSGLGQQIIYGDWGGNARQLSAWGIWPGLGVASLVGANVRVEAYSDVARTTRVYDSTALDVFTFSGGVWGTFLWGGQTWGADSLDRTARLSSIQQWFAPVTVAAFKITITNGGAVDTPYLEARRFWLADYLEAPDFANMGPSNGWMTNSQQVRTMGGSLRTRKRARWRELSFNFDLLNDADRATWADIIYQCELSNEVVFSMLPADPTARITRDFTVLGMLKELKPLTWDKPIRNKVQFIIAES